MASSTSAQPHATTIVVVGGGFGGLTFLSAIFKQKKYDPQRPIHVILLERREYYEYTPSALRCMVEPNHFEKVHVPYTDYRDGLISGSHSKRYSRQNATFELLTPCEAISLDTKNQLVSYRFLNHSATEEDNNHVIHYDYLVLSCGSDYSSPYVKPNINTENTVNGRALAFKQCHDSLLSDQNKHVVVIGGGSVGVELAGELVDLKKKNKKDFKITLIHSREQLLERCGKSAGKYSLKYFNSNGVNTLLNDRVDISPDRDHSQDTDASVVKNLTTKNGVSLDDVTMIFWCHSSHPSTNWLRSSDLAIESNGTLNVNESLQSTSHANVFVIGDINSVACEKTAGNAKYQGEHVAKLIQSILKDESILLNSLPNFSLKPFMMNVSLGQKDGTMITGSTMIMWGRLSSALKAKIETYAGVNPFKHPS